MGEGDINVGQRHINLLVLIFMSLQLKLEIFWLSLLFRGDNEKADADIYVGVLTFQLV